MFAIVVYDISDDRRRTRVGKVLEGFGSRVQKSVFECDLTEKQFAALKTKLGKVVKPEDGLRYYVLCAQCVPKVEVVGGPPIERAQLFFAV